MELRLKYKKKNEKKKKGRKRKEKHEGLLHPSFFNGWLTLFPFHLSIVHIPCSELLCYIVRDP